MGHKRVTKIKTLKDEWETPQWLFDLLDQEFHFQVDAAATKENKKTHLWFGDNGTEEFCNAIEHQWYHVVLDEERFFLNPPYSAGNIDKFMAKALEESLKGALVVCLVPCATDTKWWHNYAMKAQEIRFIKGRVRFVGYDADGKQIKNSPTFSSCVVIFKGTNNHPRPCIGPTIEQPKVVRT